MENTIVDQIAQIIAQNIGEKTADLFRDVYKNETDKEKLKAEAKHLLERSIGPENADKQLAGI